MPGIHVGVVHTGWASKHLKGHYSERAKNKRGIGQAARGGLLQEVGAGNKKAWCNHVFAMLKEHTRAQQAQSWVEKEWVVERVDIPGKPATWANKIFIFFLLKYMKDFR